MNFQKEYLDSYLSDEELNAMICEIESGDFCTAMLQILSVNYNDLKKEVGEFIDTIKSYDGVSGLEIPKDEAKYVLFSFKEYYWTGFCSGRHSFQHPGEQGGSGSSRRKPRKHQFL